MSADTTSPEYTALRADLLGRGYQQVEEHRDLQAGTRVRHSGEQYPEALMHGTASVLGIFRRDPSPWSQRHGRPDVEVLVLRDHPTLGRRLAQWADYGTERCSR